MANDAPPFSGSALEAGVQIGDFRIERRLGAGGMGIVYQARQVSLNRPVALKVLGQALTRGADVTRFQREAQAAARLKHPSIAQVYFIGQDQHLCFLAMELVEGSSLRQVLDRLGAATSQETSIDSAVQEDLKGDGQAAAVRFDLPTEGMQAGNGDSSGGTHTAAHLEPTNPYLSPKAIKLRTSAAHVRRACEIVRDAARALAHAHEQGVVHRDIKPDNLLLDKQGKVHLIDFGVARFFDDQAVTCTGQLVGTPLYMSPEQVTGRGTLDARTDVYSLGLVLYELLTLRPAVEAGNREKLLRTIATKQLVPVSWRNAAVPNALERIVHRATQKDIDERYLSAAELADELDQYLAGKPVAAPQYRFRLDEREIRAARPGGVVLAAFIFVMCASIMFMGLACIGIMTGVIGGNTAVALFGAIQAIFGAVILAVGIFVSLSLLAGRIWARWIGVILAVLLCLSSFSLMGMLASFAFLSAGSNEFSRAFDEEIKKNTVEPDKSQAATGTPPFNARRFIYAMVGMYMLPGLFGLLMGITALWCLLTRETAEWFRFAKSVRDEHRLLRHELS